MRPPALRQIPVVLVLLLAAACQAAPAAAPTLHVLPSLTPSSTPTPTVPTPTPTPTFTLTPPPTQTPAPPTATPVPITFTRIEHDAEQVVTQAHDLCLPAFKTVTAEISGESGVEQVLINWREEASGATRRPVVMSPLPDRPATWQGQIGPFSEPGDVTYTLLARDTAGNLLTSPEQTFAVVWCTTERATATITPGPSPTPTPPIIAGQELIVDVPEVVTVAHNTATTIILRFEGGVSPVEVRAGTAEHGSLRGIGASLTYTPDVDFFGEDSFSYIISDSAGQEVRGTVRLEVLPPP